MAETNFATTEVPQEQLNVQANLEALASYPEDLGGPSFAGWAPKKYFASSRTGGQPVFWHAVNSVKSNGHLVGQLGVQIVSNTQDPKFGFLHIFWRRGIILAPGIHQFTADMQLGPVTLRPHSGSPVPKGTVFLRVNGWNAPRPAALDVYPHNSWQWKRLTTAPRYLDGSYSIDVGLGVTSVFRASQKPYGEVIISRIQDVLRYGPYAAGAAPSELEKERLAAVEALVAEDFEDALVDA